MSILNEYIKKVKGGWKVYSKKGKPLSKKPHKTYKKALAQLRAVEASKRQNEINAGCQMKKLNRLELRALINEAVINEDLLDTAENAATTLLGHAGIGDAAALIKALTLDLGRAIDNLYDLNQVLKYANLSITDIGTADAKDVEYAAYEISQLDDKIKKKIREAIIEFAEAIRRMCVSVVTAFPDVFVSGSISATITALPLETFLLKGAPIIADVVNFLESGDITSYFVDMTKLVSRITSGPVAWVFGDPITSLRNLGMLIEATEKNSYYKQPPEQDDFVDLKLDDDGNYSANLYEAVLRKLLKEDVVDTTLEKGYVSQIGDHVPGGMSKDLSQMDLRSALAEIANMHSVNEEQIYQEFEIGVSEEMEHTDSIIIATEIALDHLVEAPDYYSRLEKAGL